MQKFNIRQLFPLMAVVVGVLGVIVWFYITPNKKLDQAARQVTEIAQQIRKHFVARIDYWKLDTKYVADNNILTNFVYHNGNLVNALGKKVVIGQNEDGTTIMPGDRTFGIAYTGLTGAECIALSSYHFEHPEDIGLLAITIINSDNRQSFDWGEGDYKLPINRQKAKRFCKNNSTILWTFE